MLCSFTLSAQFEKGVLKRVFETKREEENGENYRMRRLIIFLH
jgi:hypothetical protein